MKDAWSRYDCGDFYDELISSPGHARQAARKLVSCLRSLGEEDFNSRQQLAESTIREMGISFTVYTEEGNIDRCWPFDIIPRVISKRQWDKTAA
ncbi:MAG: circularly permuted type 2 ATP-grasp protein, partial [Cellvibrionaceae bacterium]|nr:circularly permuted type 2 ATP-grasp protein [Cellvibrionaceae bacterium]